jgi:cobyrinic acid a,c-diamide synthase
LGVSSAGRGTNLAAVGLIIGAPRSGAGKTTLTLAMLAALRRRGIAARAAKSGPDYIDPGFHALASLPPCMNLDSWAMTPDQLDSVMAGVAGGAELVLIESAMGLFDGVEGGPRRSGSAADLAARYHLPVLLVLDVSGQSQSAAAVARGFAAHDPMVRIGGVVLNRVASDRHRDGIVRGLEPLGLPVLGGFPRDAAIALPERHLGLVQAEEQAGMGDLLARLADLAERCLDLDAIVATAAPISLHGDPATVLAPPGQRIALARDAAFSFIYPHLWSGWRAAGADIVAFSPLADEPPPDGCDACWLPGGYPELHAARLANAARFRAGMIRFAASRPVHGECGGYMVLGTGLEDASGERHPMLGLLGHATSFARRRLHLGYREATLLADLPIGGAGSVVRGHEFHYASLIDAGEDAPIALLSDARGTSLGPAGGRRGQVSGSFFHAIASAPTNGVGA